MINIKKEDLKTRFPNNSDFFENLDEENKELYILIYQRYIYLLVNYLNRKINFIFYDNMLKSSELPFYPVSEKKMDLYQKLCSQFYDYLYIRSNIYIERLSKEEINFLKKQNFNEIEIDNFIEKTLVKVITELTDRDAEISLCFGSDSLYFYKPNTTFLLGIRYDEFTNLIPDDENWLKTSDSLLEKINLIIDSINKKASLLPFKTEIMRYNDFNINKLK